jgi:hypothetical protein
MSARLIAVVGLLWPSAANAAEPMIRLASGEKGKPAVIEVAGLDAVILQKLREHPPADWSAVFAVRVGSARTAMLGAYQVDDNTIRFEPRFPLVPGLVYRVTFDPSAATGGKAMTAEVSVPKPPTAATTVVEQIYPTRSDLPENQLKFYLHFSKPMSRGEAYRRIRLLREDGTAVESPFLELDEELWTPDGKRFTLFFHPGRVKRGLKPREALGPILEEGKRYSLVVDAGWPDEDGNPLKSDFRKSFSAGKPDDEQPNPIKWKVQQPKAGSDAALVVEFPESLDHALLQRMLWVVDAENRRVPGTIRIGKHETVWGFRPDKPWSAGTYRLMINTALEDLAGNSVASPFEVDVFRKVERREEKTVALSFVVASRP